MAAANPIRVLVWGENRHEQTGPTPPRGSGRREAASGGGGGERVRAIYPDGMHETMRSAVEQHLGERVTVTTATLDEPEHGLTEEVLAGTDVLLWWGHMAHDEVADAVVDRVHSQVLAEMGLLPTSSCSCRASPAARCSAPA